MIYYGTPINTLYICIITYQQYITEDKQNSWMVSGKYERTSLGNLIHSKLKLKLSVWYSDLLTESRENIVVQVIYPT